jgi:hypothetical protein
MAADGLDLLENDRKAKTARRARVVPPPHHPKPVVELSGGVEAVVDVDEAPPAVGESTEETTVSAASVELVQSDPSISTTPGRKRQGAPKGGGKLEKLQFYLDPSAQDYLHEIRVVVVNRKDRKLDVSASAVMRLAVQRLADQLTPEQVVDLLGSRITTDKPGRKRR